MRDVPLRVPEPPHPEALHVQHSPRVDQELAVVGLRDRALRMAEQDRGGLLHWNKGGWRGHLLM